MKMINFKKSLTSIAKIMGDETRERAIAFFVATVSCLATALIVSPRYWWLGIIAGFAAGYIGYEFKAVIKAVPLAFKKAISKIAFALKKYPIELTSIILSIIPVICSLVVIIFSSVIDSHAVNVIDSHAIKYSLFIFLVGGIYLIYLLILSTITYLTCLGYTKTKKYEAFWARSSAVRGSQNFEHEWPHPEYIDLVRYFFSGISELIGLLIKNLIWLICGIGPLGKYLLKTTSILITTILVSIAAGIIIAPLVIGFILFLITYMIYVLGEFFWHLFKLIHKKERVLCGMGGTVCGTMGYLLFSPQGLPLIQQCLVVIFCGIIGAGLGILDYKIVSIKWLGLASATTQQN